MNRFLSRLGAGLLVIVFVIALGAGLADASTTYTVQKGDSLYLVAKKFGVTVSAIKSTNGLSGNEIYVGQRLTIPGGSTSGTRHTVVKGDTIYLIAKRFGVTIDSIRQANNLWKDIVYPGQVLNIPVGSTRNVTTVSRSFSRSDINLLARAVYAEARGEVYEGQVAVAAVILNRVKHPDFPNTIAGVIYEPWAFTCVNDGQINLAPNENAYRAVEEALKGRDPSGGALFYWNPVTAQSKWVWTRTIIYRVGNHVFAK